MPAPLPRWYASYAGSGLCMVTRDGFVEPYLGDLLLRKEPRLVIMGLNPGYFDPPHLAARGYSPTRSATNTAPTAPRLEAARTTGTGGPPRMGRTTTSAAA